MSRFSWGVGTLLLVGFIGYAVWVSVLGGHNPLASYPDEVNRLVARGLVIADVERTIGQKEDERTRNARDLRRSFISLTEDFKAADRRRPSYRKLGEMVGEIEFASFPDNSKDLILARMKNAIRLADEIKGLLGGTLDVPD